MNGSIQSCFKIEWIAGEKKLSMWVRESESNPIVSDVLFKVEKFRREKKIN